MQLVRGDGGRAPEGIGAHPVLASRPIDARLWRRDAADDHWLAVRDVGAALGAFVMRRRMAR